MMASLRTLGPPFRFASFLGEKTLEKNKREKRKWSGFQMTGALKLISFNFNLTSFDEVFSMKGNSSRGS
jgi:hypothetical protein